MSILRKRRVRVPIFLLLLSFLTGRFVNSAELLSPISIYHAFDIPYEKIDSLLLKHLREIGFSHIQISPSEKSLSYGEWHEKYQPLSYEIGNSYGNSNQLLELSKRVHQNDLKLIADVVFNHMAGFGDITPENWESALHNPAQQQKYYQRLMDFYGPVFIHPYRKGYLDPTLFVPWNREGWEGGSLPQLNTLHPEVKAAQLQYLQSLIDLGVDAIRFDSIGTIDPDSLREYSRFLGKERWFYGELASTNLNRNQGFSTIMSVTDFVFLEQLLSAFSYNGSLEELRIPKTNGDPLGVTFAVNHDTWAAKISGGRNGINMTFATEDDEVLATLFSLARHDGVPLLLNKYVDFPSVQAGVRFRRRMFEKCSPQDWVYSSRLACKACYDQTFLIMERENQGIFLLNKGTDSIEQNEITLPLQSKLEGCYQNLEYGNYLFVLSTSQGKALRSAEGKVFIPKRKGLFFIQVPSRHCNSS